MVHKWSLPNEHKSLWHTLTKERKKERKENNFDAKDSYNQVRKKQETYIKKLIYHLMVVYDQKPVMHILNNYLGDQNAIRVCSEST